MYAFIASSFRTVKAVWNDYDALSYLTDNLLQSTDKDQQEMRAVQRNRTLPL